MGGDPAEQEVRFGATVSHRPVRRARGRMDIEIWEACRHLGRARLTRARNLSLELRTPDGAHVVGPSPGLVAAQLGDVRYLRVVVARQDVHAEPLTNDEALVQGALARLAQPPAHQIWAREHCRSAHGAVPGGAWQIALAPILGRTTSARATAATRRRHMPRWYVRAVVGRAGALDCAHARAGLTVPTDGESREMAGPRPQACS